MRHVVIWGQAGCGKTYHKEALKDHFACKQVIDGASNLDRPTRASVSTLYLTNEPDLVVNGPHIRLQWHELRSFGFDPEAQK